MNYYLCIDLKSFYASVECVSRGLDPMKANLVVADPSRGNGAICLAITPNMKKMGIKNRCRIFEIPCLYRKIFGFPCPACGITRAYLSLLSGDFLAAFKYHSLFWTVPIFFLFFWLDGKIFPKKWINLIVLIFLIALIIFRWIFFVL